MTAYNRAYASWAGVKCLSGYCVKVQQETLGSFDCLKDALEVRNEYLGI